jgi:hypothetical protein
MGKTPDEHPFQAFRRPAAERKMTVGLCQAQPYQDAASSFNQRFVLPQKLIWAFELPNRRAVSSPKCNSAA